MTPPRPPGSDASQAPAGPAGLPQLRRRRFALLPLHPAQPTIRAGAGATATSVMPVDDDASGPRRIHGTAPADLADLISSIARIGLLQPVLAEEIDDGPDRPPRLQVTVGRRRLAACRWGAEHDPGNPHFAAVPAIICPGPLTEEERRRWQLIENLARDQLQPGELAAALLYHRCAVLAGRLRAAGVAVPAEVAALDDPVARFTSLDRLRRGDPATAAPWSEVLPRLGLQLSARKARELVRAFAALPAELTEDMDHHKITLNTRIRYAELLANDEPAAADLWTLARDGRQLELIPGAVDAALRGHDPATALELSEDRQLAANTARAAKLRRPPPADLPGRLPHAPQTAARNEPAAGIEGSDGVPGTAKDVLDVLEDLEDVFEDVPDVPDVPDVTDDRRSVLDSALVIPALEALRALLAELRTGVTVHAADARALNRLLEQLAS